MDTTIQNAEQALSGSLSTRQTLKQYVRLTKPRIALLIVISTAVGYCYGIDSTFNFVTFLHALVGTTLLAAGAATLNQWWERSSDAKMNRTKTRPIPAGTIRARDALLFGIALNVLGVAELWTVCNILAAGLGLLTSASYVVVYTPLKRKHAVCTTVGAIPGAMPPLIGFAAARSHLGIDAWVLFSILFLWQFPHFHAIAWMYREDYERAGVKMLAVARPFGPGLTIEIMSALLLLIPITLAPTLLHMAGQVYLAAAALLDVVFVYFGFQLARERNRRRARGLLLASVLYLPVLFAFLVFDNSRFLI
ncbi:MAG: protoheme IX farnesyltransferase [Acidobacteriaceae bacterium]|nr:protoheme IX farnesyltransferase [Acidobacteriaceae bacterium]